MKKLFFLCFLPLIASAQQTGESCSNIENNEKRLECYDSVFIKIDEQKAKEQQELDQKLAEGLKKLEEKLAAWNYKENTDKMRGTSNYFATKLSSNDVMFSFPYGGGSKLGITLRKHSEYGNDILITISKGQFSCRLDNCKIAVKFDDNKVEQYAVSEPDSGGSDALFISESKDIKKFANSLKKSKKMIVEATFYDHGKEQFTFDTDGLKWEHF